VPRRVMPQTQKRRVQLAGTRRSSVTQRAARQRFLISRRREVDRGSTSSSGHLTGVSRTHSHKHDRDDAASGSALHNSSFCAQYTCALHRVSTPIFGGSVFVDGDTGVPCHAASPVTLDLTGTSAKLIVSYSFNS